MNDIAAPAIDAVRLPIAEGARPVYVSADGARVGKSGEVIEIAMPDGARHAARLGETSELVVSGNVSATTPCLHELLRRGIPVSWCAGGGWFLGQALAADHGNVALRIAQHHAADDTARALTIARAGNRQDRQQPRAAAAQWHGVAGAGQGGVRADRCAAPDC